MDKPGQGKKKGVDFTARRLLREGDKACRKGDWLLARRLYTNAHELLRHSPADHRLVHEKLVRVNRELGNWRSWLVGNLLLMSAPLGTFQLLARLRTSTGSSESVN